jgi:LPXTG-motif cell wall-anchored protein
MQTELLTVLSLVAAILGSAGYYLKRKKLRAPA